MFYLMMSKKCEISGLQGTENPPFRFFGTPGIGTSFMMIHTSHRIMLQVEFFSMSVHFRMKDHEDEGTCIKLMTFRQFETKIYFSYIKCNRHLRDKLYFHYDIPFIKFQKHLSVWICLLEDNYFITSFKFEHGSL